MVWSDLVLRRCVVCWWFVRVVFGLDCGLCDFCCVVLLGKRSLLSLLVWVWWCSSGFDVFVL